MKLLISVIDYSFEEICIQLIHTKFKKYLSNLKWMDWEFKPMVCITSDSLPNE
jgi:hypothetical protein